MEILTCGNDFHKLRFEPPSDEGGGKTLVLTEGENMKEYNKANIPLAKTLRKI